MTASDTTARTPFPEARGREKGYEKQPVDEFLARARASFEDGSSSLTAADIRQAAFPLVRRGYSIASVDAALGRIEDAFAARERSSAVAESGAGAWVGHTRELAQEVLDRLARPAKRRFDRVSALRYGYRIAEVDLVTDKLARYLETGESVTVEQVRSVAFRMQRGGYREGQVDAVLDAVVEVMLAVR
ncbi:DivIVA domain-containing protein [Microbacterium sp. M3]|jgi:DivIVA domain-containing protein|uniref:DivIVA domain-containing protein n=1 Tax=Microbacterium arthrosphaerae TaxID=792652 RepID=A0ABU4H0H7_9MICO|nr:MULTISPECIES: DivIVA domain-containing protein [Microbacterium]MDW4572826.1 DivIVA domain-containing protein [Microbacterium arthrosphaerae]MDW7606681.1 DivIVA domain-containing protein [Microbacterium sp. M3]